tara:strand:+ start:1778 stop:1924 length:147 start_codon:yes stop_codon:yes gene_type:complete
MKNKLFFILLFTLFPPFELLANPGSGGGGTWWCFVQTGQPTYCWLESR